MALPTNIKNILNDKIVESVRLELKESWNPESILHTICAFANDINNFSGGYIVIGIDEENGKPAYPIKGLSNDEIDVIQKELVEYCKKALEPKYLPVIDVVEYQDAQLVVIWAYAGADRPYKCTNSIYPKNTKGDSSKSYYIRKGSTTVKATSSDEKELFALSGLSPFDDRINYKASIKDLKTNLIRNYLHQIDSNLYEPSANMSIEQLAENLRICEGPKEAIYPKNVGLLFFTYNPEIYFPYAYIDLTIIYDPTGEGMIEKKFTGPLNIQYNDAMFYIKNNIIQEKVFKISGQMEAKRYFNYPYEAIEELLGNAILHKSYQIPEPISIRITREEFEITSLPGIDVSINDNDVKDFKWRTRRYRNRRISEFLKELHIVEAKNTGIPTIIKALHTNGSPMPIIEMDTDRSYLTVKLPIHKAFLENTYERNYLAHNADIDFSLVREKYSLRDAILLALNGESCNLTSLSKKLGYSSISGSLKDNLKMLELEGYIVVENRVYSITSKGKDYIYRIFL